MRIGVNGSRGRLLTGALGAGLLAPLQAATAPGPCSLLIVSRPMLPATPCHRAYELPVDARRRFSRRTSPRLDSTLSLSRR